MTTINIHVASFKAPKYIKQILTKLKGEIDSNTIIVGYLNTPLSTTIDHPDKKSIRTHYLNYI